MPGDGTKFRAFSLKAQTPGEVSAKRLYDAKSLRALRMETMQGVGIVTTIEHRNPDNTAQCTWDWNLTWETDEPEFTQCFQNSLLVWVPCGWLWLVLIPYAIGISKTTGPEISNNWKNITKTICGVLLILVALADILKTSNEASSGLNPPIVLYVSPGILAVTMLLAVILIQVERRKGFVTSGMLFIHWLLLLVAGIIPFYSKILDVQHNNGVVEDVFRFTTFYVYYAMIIMQFILSCIADTRAIDYHRSLKECPEVRASFLSRITFAWIDPLVLMGYRKPLHEDDVWDLNERDISANTTPRFEKAWQEEMVKSGLAVRSSKGVLVQQQHSNYGSMAGGSKRSFTDSMKERLLSSGEKDKAERTPLLGKRPNSSQSLAGPLPKVREPSIVWALTKCYGLELFKAQCCKFVYDILTFVGPILQSNVIAFTEDKSMQPWKGYMYAAMFFFTGIVQSLFFHQLFHIGMTLGMRIKAAAISIVYKKALTMSNEARKGTTVGEIVNLMSVDAQRLQDVTGYLWMVWSCPLQIAISIYMLWGIVGPSSLAGLAVMILLIPINGALATIQRKLQISQMKQKDQRIKLMNEVLNGIKVLKLYAWELSFQDKINVIRNMELETLKRYSYLMAVGTFTWTCAPFLVTLATFMSFVLSGNELDSNTAFVSLSLFNILRFPINLLPMMISYIVTAMVSVKRLSKFLQQGDIDLDNVSRDQGAQHRLTIERGTFAWGTSDDDLPVLKNINVKIADGELVAVVGPVGCGKSSLLSAFLGEMEKFCGMVNLRGLLAYVPQQAWIQNATLRENILFGKPYDEEKYENILEACALKPDLEILPGGDMTEIGEKGINLSGGQKQRISLARAIYSNTDIYLLDDPLSAVDAHVGKHIFEKVIGPEGLLKGKTRVLVTHGVQWLPKMDSIIVLLEGDISEMGSYEDLLSHDGAFATFLKTYLLVEDSDSDSEDPEIAEIKDKMLERIESVVAESAGKTTSPSESESASEAGIKRRLSRKQSKVERQLSRKKSTVEKEKEKIVEVKAGEKLIEKETSEAGGVKWSVFYAYIRSLGVVLALLLVLFFLLYQIFSVLSNVWLSSWTEDDILKNISIANTSVYQNQQNFYLGVYGGLGGAQALFVLIYAIISAISMVRASRKLHAALLYNILRSSMAFFDTTPIGRILNRFSRDIETIDNILPNMLRSWMNTFFTVISTIIVISYSTPIFLAVIVPLFILYFFIQRFYVPTSRQLKRIESTSRSPIYTHFSETISGASSIRAYCEQDRFTQKTEYLVNHNLAYYFYSIASNRWLGFRLEFLGAGVVFAAALFAVVSRDTITGGLVGLSISYALQVTQSLNWMVRMTSDLETNIVSVERIIEYTETPTEDDWYIEDTRPPRGWPNEGRIAFEEYKTRYREGLDLVLKGITAHIDGGEKVGIIGRTGAGKSSLTLALFRIIEAASGSILIDGIHIGNLGLHQLRGKITILPQDPVLFSGSLRMNLDPFDRFTDDEIWGALTQAHLKDFVAALPAGLTYECGEGGQNLSVGQRQLVCLGRTLLHKTKILILDEATAAVDLETDELIQNTIREEFADCTIMTIAHRINTIMDSDRVMVLDAGRIAEFDTPGNLLRNKNSIFSRMAQDAGITS